MPVREKEKFVDELRHAGKRPPVIHRRMPIGAEVQPQGGVHFRVWAPQRSAVAVLVAAPGGAVGAQALSHRGGEYPLAAEGNGYFSGIVDEVAAGMRYGFRLNGGDKLYTRSGVAAGSRTVRMSCRRSWTRVRLHGTIPIGQGRRGKAKSSMSCTSASHIHARGNVCLPRLAKLGIWPTSA